MDLTLDGRISNTAHNYSYQYTIFDISYIALILQIFLTSTSNYKDEDK